MEKIDKEILQKALSPLITSALKQNFDFKFEGSDDMNGDEIHRLLLSEYSNDAILSYINKKMQKVCLFEAQPTTALGKTVNEIYAIFPSEHLKPLLIDEPACLIGGTYSGVTSMYGLQYASSKHLTWLTTSGKILVTEEFEYGEAVPDNSENEPSDYLIRKVKNDTEYANASFLTEYVGEWAKDIWR